MNQDIFDVAISGYGPTGMAAASLLARRGHRVIVFERHGSLYGAPRVATIDGESARIIQAAGDHKEALRNSSPRLRYLLANGEGQVLVDFDWSGTHVCGHPYRISLHQPDVEDALDAAARAAGAVIQQGWAVAGLGQEGDHVSVSAQNNTGQTQAIKARYMIGADGARSTTRELLGIERESWPFRGAWLTFDCTRRRALPNFLGVSPDGRIAATFCAPQGRAHSIIPLGRDVIRVTFQIDPDADRTAVMTRESAYRYLKNVHGLTQDDVDVFRPAMHVFEGKLAKNWRAGRIFIGGDAAHAMTPFMGQGGCSSLRDAVNLSWKLDLVLRGIAKDALLDTYESERKPHARFYVDGSDKLGALAFIDDPDEAAQRDRRYIGQTAVPSLPEPKIESGIIHLDAKGKPVAPAGEVGPQGRVRWSGSEGLFDDLFGWGFQILWRGASPAAILGEAQLAKLKSLNCAMAGFSPDVSNTCVQDVDGVYARFFEAHEVNGLIVRPDFVVHSGARSTADLRARVDELIAQLVA